MPVRPSAMPPMTAPAMKLDRGMLLMWGSKIAYRMLRGSDDGHSSFLRSSIFPCRRRDSRLCAGADFRTVCAADDVGGVSGLSAGSFECSLAPALPRPVSCRHRAHDSRTHRHLAAVKRAIGGVRVADIGVAAPSSKSDRRYGHQDFFGFTAVSMDRSDQYLVAGTRQHFSGATAILAGFRHERSDAARRKLGRLAFLGGVGIGAGLCNHVVSVVLFSARWGQHER